MIIIKIIICNYKKITIIIIIEMIIIIKIVVIKIIIYFL